MNFKIDFGDQSIGALSRPQIDSFSYTGSIFKIYAGAKLTIKDVTKTINNQLKTGMKAKVIFYDDKKSYENEMRVLSFSKANTGNAVDYVDVVLVSAMYFDDTTKTMTYSGSISQILTDVFDNVFVDSVPKKNFVSTEDRIRRRYQLSEKTQDFVKRILKYGIRGSLPVYLYNAPDGTLYLKGVYDMISENPKVAASSVAASQLIQQPEGESTLSELIFWSHTLGANSKDTSSVIKNIFCTDNFAFSTKLANEVECCSVEKNNCQAEIETPSKTKFFNWNYTPDDAQSIAVKEAFEETIGTFGLSATFQDFIIDELALGSTVFVILPFEPTVSNNSGAKVNLGEGKYLITQVTYIYEEHQSRTIASMLQIAS